ncbi:MAG: ABC transporter permease [Planctomycetes bacterium]|nr:ABC transporter permease [Planctomycetota bacterium]
MSDVAPQSWSNRVVRAIAAMPGRVVTAVGEAGFSAHRRALEWVRYVGGVCYLLYDATVWVGRGLFVPRVKLGWGSLASQMVRVGVRSIPIIVLVQTFIGIILALQMAPTLQAYGSLEKVANIVAIAMFRELGPLLSAIVLSGFAGASIAAEIGAMVEAEEIKALRAHALNPIRFLVVPRLLATVIMLTGLAVLADVVGVAGGLLTSWFVLDIRPQLYLENTRFALEYKDFLTGLVKAGVFGMLIAMIACHEGLSVRGGAEGVGRGTTSTVVKSIVALIATDCVFTAAFYLFGL